MKAKRFISALIIGIIGFSAVSCGKGIKIQSPFIPDDYAADPSAHVFDGTLYIYPSHDLENNIQPDSDGSQYDMKDFHVYSYSDITGKVKDHGEILHIDNVSWADSKMWAPDAAQKNGKTYFYFPAKDEDGIFRIGVAVADSPTGPFEAMDQPIDGVYSMDPAAFVDDDGQAYLYFGGLMGGQLEHWSSGTYNIHGVEPKTQEPAIGPRVALLADNMTEIEGPVIEILILDEKGEPVTAGNHHKRFFEGAWMHKYQGTYYLSYSTGDTHKIVYATSDNPLGPFTYRGIILEPVVGWTTHHSIVEYKDRWYLFYHSAAISGLDHLRNTYVAELQYNSDGTMVIIDN